MSGERAPDAGDIERGKRLAALREAAGFERQLDLAAAANISSVEVSRAESGKNRFTSDMMKIAYSNAFGMTPGALTDYIAGVITLEEVRQRWSPRPVPRRKGDEGQSLLQDDPFPARAAAIVLLREKGFPPGVLEALRLMAFKGAEDFSIQDFIDKGREILAVSEGIDPVRPAAAPRPEDDPKAPPTREQIARLAETLPAKTKRPAKR